MNLGQFLTARSPLPSGTVAQHLAAIASSAGTGVDKVIYCSQISTVVERDELMVTRKAKRSAQAESSQPMALHGSDQRSVFSFTQRPSSVQVLTSPDEVFVTRKPARSALKFT